MLPRRNSQEALNPKYQYSPIKFDKNYLIIIDKLVAKHKEIKEMREVKEINKLSYLS